MKVKTNKMIKIILFTSICLASAIVSCQEVISESDGLEEQSDSL